MTDSEFWSAAEAGQLLLPECGACSTKFFPPEPYCPACLADDWSWVPSHGVGVIYSHTTCQRPHIAGIVAPYVLAIIQLDDGWTLLSNIVGPEQDHARIGDRVVVRFEDRPIDSDTRPAPVFILDRSTPGASA